MGLDQIAGKGEGDLDSTTLLEPNAWSSAESPRSASDIKNDCENNLKFWIEIGWLVSELYVLN